VGAAEEMGAAEEAHAPEKEEVTGLDPGTANRLTTSKRAAS
jgi:hypothetical protein